MKRLRSWLQRRFAKPTTGVAIVLGRESRVNLLDACVDDLKTGAHWNRNQAGKILSGGVASISQRKQRRAAREYERAAWLGGLAAELERRRARRVRDLPRRRLLEIVDTAELLARPVPSE